MSKLMPRLARAIESAGQWSPEQQEAAAEVLESLGADQSPYVLSKEERADLTRALEEVSRGEIATDADVTRVFGRRVP